MTAVIQNMFPNRNLENSLGFIHLSRKGITTIDFALILDYMSISVKEIAKILPISERQLLRYDKDKLFRKDLSSQILQVLRLYVKGYEIFGNKANFQKWMNRPSIALGSSTPFDLLDTPFGIQLVKNELGRMEHGVLS